jgi:hypothetical protein
MTDEEEIIYLIKKELLVYKDLKPKKNDLYMVVIQQGVLELDKNFDTYLVSRVIDEGNYAAPETRREEKINSVEDIKTGDFYKNTVSGRTCRTQSVQDGEVIYHYFDFGIDMKSVTIENFIKYFVHLPDTDSYVEEF